MTNSMQRYELEAWLGEGHGLPDEQITDLLHAAEDIAARYPDPDDAEEREAALTVAYRLLIEPAEQVVDELRERRTQAKIEEARAYAGIRQAAVSLIWQGGAGVESQQGFSKRSGVDRMVVRRWIGA